MPWRPARTLLTGPLFDRARKALPALSATEREALSAGDVWWDAALFSGDPDWNRLLSLPQPRLSEEERAFLDGPVQELCALVDDWRCVRRRGPADRVTHACAELLMRNDATRERITDGVFRGCRRDGIDRVERAFCLAHEVAPLRRKAAGVLTPGEAAQIRAADEAVRAAIQVDDFAADELFGVRPDTSSLPRADMPKAVYVQDQEA